MDKGTKGKRARAVPLIVEVRTPQRRRCRDPDTGGYRRLSTAQKAVNTAHARQRGPGERANAELKNWKILRKIRSSPNQAGRLVAAVQALMIATLDQVGKG